MTQNSNSADIFAAEFASTARRALSAWNRDPGSPSFGSFDRSYWGWKAKDFSDMTLQYAARICVEYVIRTGGPAQGDVLNDWLQGFVGYCRRAQHRDGSFDQCYPHERAPGVVYDILPTLLYVRDCGYVTAPGVLADLDGVIERGVSFALAEDERHGEIANHFAHYAFELLSYGRLRSAPAATARGSQYLDRLLSLFDRDEGWFREYQGPDAGYQTRTLRYLTKCAELDNDAALWDCAQTAATFLESALMPDGSVHPMLGSRATALVYPSGFLRLARHAPRFSSLAALVQTGWATRRVPLPSMLDLDNAIRLADDALDASQIPITGLEPRSTAAPSRTEFPNAGLTVWRDRSRMVFVASRLGGVVVVYEQAEDGVWHLRHEDSGYLVQSRTKDTRWVSRFAGSGVIVSTSPSQITLRLRVARSLHEDLNPLQLVGLRILNATVLRIQWIGDLFRKIVVRRLMERTDWLPLEIDREVVVDPDRVTITDRVRGAESMAGSQLYRCRRVTGTHMASARYFQEQEVELASAWCQTLPWPGAESPLESVVHTSAAARPNRQVY